MTGAIVHEWIEKSGGAERVLDSFVATFPDADVFALWNDAPGRFGDRQVNESWLARTPLRHRKAAALPLLPVTWRRLNRRKHYDWLLVSSHLFAHHASFTGERGQKATPKYVYTHTPARYIWTPELDARGRSTLARIGSSALRPLDRRRAQEAVSIAANSAFVRERIKDTWRRDSVVIHPPVDVARISNTKDWEARLPEAEAELLSSLPTDFVLGASRFVHYKRLDLVILAADRVGLPAVIAGSGEQESALRELATSVSVPVHFVISPSDALLYALYQRASVFAFPAVEDFGIMPVEAMAAGCPVVTIAAGGAKESMTEGVSGAIAEEQSVPAIADAIARSLTLNRTLISETISRFSQDRFAAEIKSWISYA